MDRGAIAGRLVVEGRFAYDELRPVRFWKKEDICNINVCCFEN